MLPMRSKKRRMPEAGMLCTRRDTNSAGLEGSSADMGRSYLLDGLGGIRQVQRSLGSS
jgi:hypothetical protein